MTKPPGIILLLTLLACPLWIQAGATESTQKISVKATGTGRTTGHIADLIVRNKSKLDIVIMPQRVFIPSAGQYQPYIADIPGAHIKADSTFTLQLTGYCTDAHLPAAPSSLELIPMAKWIPIRLPDSTLIGEGLYLVSRNSVVPFTRDHIGYMVTSSAYSPMYPPPDTLNIATWPGTDIPVSGSLNHLARPDLYATLMCRVLMLLEETVPLIQQKRNYSTPFSITPDKEKAAIIQHVIWMYASALSGKKYGKEEFSLKIYEQFKSKSSLTEIPFLEMEELDEGIDEFWNVFMEVVEEIDIFHSKEQRTLVGTLVDLPTDTILYPWSMISMTDILMKPNYIKVAPVKLSSPVIPILAGSTSAGTLLYIAFHKQTTEEACSLMVTLQPSPSACHEENGSILLSTNAESSYTYLWSNGATSKDLNGLAPGFYSVTVTQSGTTCADTASTMVENINPALITSISTQDAHCGNEDGQALVTVDPPGFYTYAWSTGSMDQNQFSLGAGTYNLIVSTASGCSDTSIVTINDLPPSFGLSFVNQPAACGAADGSALAVAAPKGEYSYLWSNGSTTAGIQNVPSGVYSVTVTRLDENCTIIQETTIDELSASFTISVSTTEAACGHTDGTATLVIDPAGEYEYMWSNGLTSSAAGDLAPGSYMVTVTLSGTHCTDSIQFEIGESTPSFTISTSTTPASCGLHDGSATAVVDPPGTYDFNWSNGQSGPQATDLAPGTYMITVSVSGTQCTQSAEITIDPLPPGFTLSSETTSAGCGLSDGTATVVVEPTGMYNYIWSNGQTTPQATGLSAGMYTVTVTLTGSACMQEINIAVDELPASFTVNTTSTPSTCGLDDGTIITVVDPPGEYMYQWSNGQSGAQLTDLSSGQYIVSVSVVGSSCFVSDTIVVDQLSLAISTSFEITSAACGVANGSAVIAVDPAGTYSYAWSNGQTGNLLQQVIAGNYTVTISDTNACTAQSEVSISENQAHYLELISTAPATCLGGGDISFVLVSPGSGPLQVDITTPGGPLSLSLAAGSYVLSSFVNVLPGTYAFAVFDQSLGMMCHEDQSTQIEDQTPLISAMDDQYSTQSDQPVNGNVLENDFGLNITLVSVENNIGGQVAFSADGNFTFTPNAGFSGTGSFAYTIMDACGNITTAQVTVTVLNVPCEITIMTTLTPANCDLNNGAIAVQVNEAGTYQYAWSNGQSGAMIANVEAGIYTVTIQETTSGCTQQFTIPLTEYPAQYISNIIITQPSCLNAAEIQFTMNTQGAVGFLTVAVYHPNGFQSFTIAPGLVVLSDYVDVVEGDYNIEVFIGAAGPDCIDAFSATINSTPSIAIQLESVSPPSSAGASDGMAIISLTDPGIPPYAIYLNGNPYGSSGSSTIIIPGLMTGFYDVYIVDAPGCVSNTIPFIIPIPNIVFSFGASFSSLPVTPAGELLSRPLPVLWSTGLTGSIQYHLGRTPHEVRGLYAQPFTPSGHTSYSFLRVEYLTELLSLQKKLCAVRLNGGTGWQTSDAPLFRDPTYLLLGINSTFNLSQFLHLEAELRLTGWKTIEPPEGRIVLSTFFSK